MGRKKTGLGQGKLVGPGGKLERGETPAEAIVREVAEEVGLAVDANSLECVGEVEYLFPHKVEWSQKSWVFLVNTWTGEPIESAELRPEWHPMDNLPFGEMWDDARYWLGGALGGRLVKASFTFGPDGHTVVSTN